MIRIQAEAFDPGAELGEMLAAGGGAVVSFVGVVRGEGATGAVDALEIDHYPGFTEASVSAIAAEAKARFALTRLAVIHRYGRLNAGEPIVFVAAAARHRRGAFDAVDYVMDRLKTDAAFWKKENGAGGVRWIEARDEDKADRRRWDGDLHAVRN